MKYQMNKNTYLIVITLMRSLNVKCFDNIYFVVIYKNIFLLPQYCTRNDIDTFQIFVICVIQLRTDDTLE